VDGQAVILDIGEGRAYNMDTENILLHQDASLIVYSVNDRCSYSDIGTMSDGLLSLKDTDRLPM
jgi:hypothetical protein